MLAREVRAWFVMVVIAAVAVVMSGCTPAAEAPGPSPTSTAGRTDGGNTSVVDASSELEKLPDVERFLEQAVAQVRQKYPDQVPQDFTAASIMGELDAIDTHVDAGGVFDYAAAKSDPAITTDTLDPYARTYRALGGELTGSEAADADAASEGAGGNNVSSMSVEHVSAVRLDTADSQTADEGQGEKNGDPRVGYQGPRQFVADRPEWVEDYKAVGDEVLQGKVLYFESEYNLARMRFSAELDSYLRERAGEDQTVVIWGGIMEGPLGACIVDTDVYHEQVLERGAADSEVCLTRTVSGSTVPEPLLPLDAAMPEVVVAVEADVQQLIIQELWPIMKDFIGLTDLEKRFTEADILACTMTLISVLPVGKAIKAVKAIPAVVKAVEKIVTFIAAKGKKLPVAAPPGCFRSFAAPTPVLMADGSYKPIHDVRPGDEVHATDPISGLSGPRRVIDTFVHQDTLVDLRLASGKTITTTADHPFWSSSDHTFQDARDLARGEKVLSADGTELTVSGLDIETTREGAAYNIAVLSLHTYHVGIEAILVHNACGPVVGASMTFDNVTTSFRKLDPGRNPKNKYVKTVSSQDELRDVFDSWSAGADRVEPRGDKVSDAFELADGTRIQWRTSSRSGGATIEVLPMAGRERKVHINGG
ncbi:polymorphic toxin-type HINT domain-containing protein [Promicromonospora sp. NPDC023987]|uniref:polymorphic toxin-type HINT domain-containing protein n=1 Tax=Promicromonospora sp. NPDC023987 TaxID=3155360 RepID=UPI0033D05229